MLFLGFHSKVPMCRLRKTWVQWNQSAPLCSNLIIAIDCEVFSKKTLNPTLLKEQLTFCTVHGPVMAEDLQIPVCTQWDRDDTAVPPSMPGPSCSGSEFAAVSWVEQTDWAAALDGREPPETHSARTDPVSAGGLGKPLRWIHQKTDFPAAPFSSPSILVLSRYLCPLWSRPLVL